MQQAVAVMAHNKLRFLHSVFFFLAVACSSAVHSQNVDLTPDEQDMESQPVAVLRALDKITARITEMEVAVGSEAVFGTLILKPVYCRTRAPIEPPETFAYLEIDDVNRQGGRDRVFEGWMLASSPALNPLEHPVYDVWVINCKTKDGGADTDS